MRLPPDRRKRSPCWSPADLPVSWKSETRSSSLENHRRLPRQTSDHSTQDATKESHEILSQLEEGLRHRLSQPAPANANIRIASPKIHTLGPRGQIEGTASKLPFSSNNVNFLHADHLAMQVRSPEAAMATHSNHKKMGNLPSLPSIDKTQEDQSAPSQSSGALHRLRVPADDSSSVTSSSTKSSQRKKQCAHCKAPNGSLLGNLIKCSACSRRYHASCGIPNPDSTKKREVFTCGRCLRNSRVSMFEQARAVSPELGTPNNDGVMPDAKAEVPIQGLEFLGFALQHSGTGEETSATQELNPKLEKSKTKSEPRPDNASRPPVSAASGVPKNEYIGFAQTAVLEVAGTSQIFQGDKEGALADPDNDHFHAGRGSMTVTERAVSASTYPRPYVMTEAEEGDKSPVSDLLPLISVTSAKANESCLTDLDGPEDQRLQHNHLGESASPKDAQPEIILSTPNEIQPKEVSTTSVAPTSIRDHAAKMVSRYKTVTCPDWLFSGCKFTSNYCNFAHHDTGIDLPDRGRYNPHWTCYEWMHTPLCPFQDRCPYAHTDTGLYVGSNGKCSTKHLTCAFWQAGGCRHSDERCLFAHQDTGYSVAGRVEKDVIMRAGMMNQSRHVSEAGSRDFRPSWESKGNSHALSGAWSPRETRPATFMVPTIDDRPPGMNVSSGKYPGPAIAKVLMEAQDIEQPLSPAVSKQTTTARDLVESTSTTYSSLYSPKTTTEGSKPLHGVNTSCSPTSSIVKGERQLVYGVDTPYSPTFTTATTEQSSPKRDDDESNPRSDLIQRSLQREASSRLGTPFSPVSAFTLKDSGSPLSSFAETHFPPNWVRGRKEQYTGAANAATESEKGPNSEALPIGTSSSKIQETDASSCSRDQDAEKKPGTRTAQASSTVSKHYAKRSTVDPRTLRRNLLASAAAKSASPVDVSVSNITSIKKCQKCNKRIFGSALRCASCSEDSAAAHASPDRVSEEERSVICGHTQDSILYNGVPDDNLSGVAKFMEPDEARRVLAVAKKDTVTSIPDPVAAKSLKRPYEDAVFIQRKRPKIVIPQRKLSMASREGQGSETALIQGLSIVDSKLKVSEPQSMEQAMRDHDEEKATDSTPSATSRDFSNQPQGVEAQDQPSNDKGKRRPSFSSVSQTTEEQDAMAGVEGVDSEVTPTTLQHHNKSRSQYNNSTKRTQPETEADEADKQERMVKHTSKAQNDGPEHRIMLKFNIKRTKAATRCSTCKRNHKTCLHSSPEQFDPARCTEYLEKVRIGARKQDPYWKKHLVAITAAAHRHTGGENEDDSHTDDQSEDDEREYQRLFGFMDRDSPSSSEDPLGHIDTYTTQGLRAHSDKSDAVHVHSASTEKANDSSLHVHPAIPTPAHTPSPAVGSVEVSTLQQTPSKAASQPTSKLPKPDLKKLLGTLRKRGVEFDTDDDSDEDMDNAIPSATCQPQSCWPPKASSLNLFEVAPVLRPPQKPATTVPKPAPTIPNLRAGLSKKELWKNLSQIQCAERRARYGNPHKLIDRDIPSQIVKTTIQEEVPLTEQQRPAFHVPAVEIKEVKMPFERFLRMPEEPVVVRENKFRNREGKVVEFDLAYRDGKRERGVTLGGRKVRDVGERWPFARG